MPQDITLLIQFLRDEAASSGDHFMQAADLIEQLKSKNEVMSEVVKALRAEVAAADEQMKLLAAENFHLMNVLVNMQSDSFAELIPSGASMAEKCQLNHQRINAERGLRASMPATNKILDLVRMEYLAELSRMTCPVSGKVFDENAQATFCELMIGMKGGDDE